MILLWSRLFPVNAWRQSATFAPLPLKTSAPGGFISHVDNMKQIKQQSQVYQK